MTHGKRVPCLHASTQPWTNARVVSSSRWGRQVRYVVTSGSCAYSAKIAGASSGVG